MALSDIERLTAIEDIRQMKARRDMSVDAKDWATYEAFHTPDFVSYKENGDNWVGAKKAAEMAELGLRDALSIHRSIAPIITVHDATHAHGLWTMTDTVFFQQDGQEHWFRGFGHYDETYVKVDGRWLFATRRLTRVKTTTSPGAVWPRKR